MLRLGFFLIVGGWAELGWVRGARRQFTFGWWRKTPIHFRMVAHDANSLWDGGARRQFTLGHLATGRPVHRHNPFLT